MPYELALITGNAGAVAAVERATDRQPENRAMLEAVGVFSKRVRQGVVGNTSAQQKENAVRTAVDGLRQSGYITAEDGEAIFHQAIEGVLRRFSTKSCV